MPTNRTKETPEVRAWVQPVAAPSASAVVPQREVIASAASPPVEAPTMVALPAVEREEFESISPAPALVRAWEHVSETERQENIWSCEDHRLGKTIERKGTLMRWRCMLEWDEGNVASVTLGKDVCQGIIEALQISYV